MNEHLRSERVFASTDPLNLLRPYLGTLGAVSRRSGKGASRAVPAAKAERRLWVPKRSVLLIGDVGRSPVLIPARPVAR